MDETNSLWDKIIHGNEIDDRIIILDQSNNKLVFEYKTQEYTFEHKMSTLKIFREITDISRVEYSKSIEKVS